MQSQNQSSLREQRKLNLGLVFSAHVENFGFAIANGGQYSYQKIEGKKRPAIGFDIDLISLLNIQGNLV